MNGTLPACRGPGEELRDARESREKAGDGWEAKTIETTFAWVLAAAAMMARILFMGYTIGSCLKNYTLVFPCFGANVPLLAYPSWLPIVNISPSCPTSTQM